MNNALARRQQALDLRIRLERVAVTAFTAVCVPARSPGGTNIATRLLFLVGLVDTARQPEVHRLARLGAHVYSQTSDVLHGRTNAVDLSDVAVDEWRAVVVELEAVLEPRTSTGS